MWSHLRGAEFTSGNIWWDIWNSLARSFFLAHCLSFSFCRTWGVFFSTARLISSAFLISATSHSDPSMSQLFVSSSVCHSLRLVSVSPHSLSLSPSVPFSCFSSFSSLHYSISLLLTTPTLAKPGSQTFRDFLGDCKQVSPTLCRHELVLMLQLWKSTAHNPVKQGNQQAKEILYCGITTWVRNWLV